MNETKKGNKMTKTQMTKLIKAIEQRIAFQNENYGYKQKLVPAENQEELRFPDAPTWNTAGEGEYDFHIVYWTSRDANTNKGGRVSMPSKDRWATFEVSHEVPNAKGTSHIKKTNTVTVVDNVIKIHTVIRNEEYTIARYNHEVEMTEKGGRRTGWYSIFAKAIIGASLDRHTLEETIKEL